MTLDRINIDLKKGNSLFLLLSKRELCSYLFILHCFAVDLVKIIHTNILLCF